ncbi:hypothetical protein [Cellulosimicrobium cellulans]|uniref:hypothetical protein n=1 Tax=Cellulosimicrobium cellulans TaxID=1710 RepID=UPI0020CB74B8|nr:hypothetical protein NMQ07_12805 [Cellulosimicrobium cellulans]
MATNHSLRHSKTFHTRRAARISHSHHSTSTPSPTAGPACTTSQAIATAPATVVATGSRSIPQWWRVAMTTRSPLST